MKRLQITLFSLLTIMAIAARADAALDRRAAECDQFDRDIKQANEIYSDRAQQFDEGRVDAATFHAARRKYNQLIEERNAKNCSDVWNKKIAADRQEAQAESAAIIQKAQAEAAARLRREREEQGLSPQ